jgi:hypothetical protein
VKLFSFLFNIRTFEIIKIGTSYCKNHGLLKEHLKNDFLITVLRENYLRKNNTKENLWILSKLELEDRITRRFIEFESLYFEKQTDYSNTPENDDIIYYDFYLPIVHFKKDILEIIDIYGNSEIIDEILEKIERFIEKISKIDEESLKKSEETKETEESEESEESEETEEILDRIKNEIIELLGEESVKKETIIDESPKKQEILENQESLNSLNKIQDNINPQIKIREISINEISINKIRNLSERINNLKYNIGEFKIEVAIFQTNLKNLKKNIEIQRKTMDLFLEEIEKNRETNRK